LLTAAAGDFFECDAYFRVANLAFNGQALQLREKNYDSSCVVIDI
jgi:hypothetical protein